MKHHKNIRIHFLLGFFTFLLYGCSALTPAPTPKASTSPTLTREELITPTKYIQSTTAQSSAEPTIDTLDSACQPPSEEYGVELSPDGNWIAVVCKSKDIEMDSYLQVLNMQNNKGWSIHYADYSNGTEYDPRNMIRPFHWSTDGEYLYTASAAIGSGCCTVGWDILLVQLNLNTGEQISIVNLIEEWHDMTDFSFSPSDKYLLYETNDNLHILEIQSLKERIIELDAKNLTGAGHILMSNDDKKVLLVFQEYPEERQGDLTYGSLVIIDLESGTQKRLLSGIDYLDIPQPIDWDDDKHAILKDNDKLWLLNIQTAELTEITE